MASNSSTSHEKEKSSRKTLDKIVNTVNGLYPSSEGGSKHEQLAKIGQGRLGEKSSRKTLDKIVNPVNGVPSSENGSKHEQLAKIGQERFGEKSSRKTLDKIVNPLNGVCPSSEGGSKHEQLAKIRQGRFGIRDKSPREQLLEKIASADFPFCEEVSLKYEKLAKIGQGTFGEVFKARNRATRKIVALKKVLMENEKEGFPITALREIKILQLLKYENVVNLIEICRTSASPADQSNATFYLVFDFCEHDLAGLLGNVNVKFTLGEIKMVMKQLLNGLYFIHSNEILHRDMKAANILITKHGVLKLADFGLARVFSVSKSEKPNRYTNTVVTLWYRPPEILLGERNYGPPIDMWGAGCIMAEMWTRSPILQGSTEQEQLKLISQLCGSITPDSFPGVEKLELYAKLELPKGHRRRVKERLKAYMKDDHALDLLDKLLTIDPAKRIDSDTALNHDFFWVDPLPCDLTQMLLPHTQSMFEYLFSKKKNGQIQHAAGAGAPSRLHPGNNDGQYHDRVF